MLGLPPLLDAALRAIVFSVMLLAWIVVFVRIIGLRTFSKMTAFDFIITLATGSLLATGATANSWPAFLQAFTALSVLLVAQVVLAKMRQRSEAVAFVLENKPLLLMRDGRFLDAALVRSRVTRADVRAKLREANALDLSTVRAVVLETTGDISVMHGGHVDAVLLDEIE